MAPLLHDFDPGMLTLVRNADVFGPGPLGLRDLLVADERIAAIEPRLDPTGVPCDIVDLAGARVVPGLVDCHVHLGGGGGEQGPASRVPPVDPSALARAGVTTVVGILGTDGTTRHPSDLLARVRAVREAGLSAFMWTGSYELPPRTLTGSVRSDIVTVPEVIGAGEIAVSDHRSSQPTFDEIAKLAADCHVGGLLANKRARLHLHMGDGRRGLEVVRRAMRETELPVAVFHPTHVNRSETLFSEACELAARGLVVDVTATPGAADAGLSADRAIVRFLDAGLPPHGITASSDAGGSLPQFDDTGAMCGMGVGDPSGLLGCIFALLRMDVPPERALSPFTESPARHLGLRRKGRIAVGYDADLLVLDGDAPRTVMARGRWAVRDGVPIAKGRFER